MKVLNFLLTTILYFCPILGQDLVELNNRNMITIRGPIQHESVSDFMLKSSKIDSDNIFI